MEREEKQGSSKGSAVAAGIVCGFIGAVIGAFGYHIWKKEEVQQHSYSQPKKVYSGGICPICLTDCKELSVLPCGHQYHRECREQAEKHKVPLKCAVCRQEYRK